ncbi:MAG TPA: DUF3006 domain-containing protein [Methanospirillum sp.]|uniref:DUF3006 domain-containing protein n=1 Tax=Methanospirillum sp. TaxID=45200 RepID=UPI002C13C01C|nr:DUF3006 domain-containing protein [Methanospirillum sp.]HWQ64757.1 DUF3006 domain-containing protein [Methanospirillum sp.]
MVDASKTVVMTIDRIEDGYLILIPRDHPDEMIQFPRKYVGEFEEGDILELSIRKDESATREARDRIIRLRERLVNR